MAVGKPVRWDAVPDEHGRLLETPDGVTRNGVDLDAVRMYLRWRGLTLSELRERADHFRNPATLPAKPNPPGDGSVGVEEARADGGAVDGEVSKTIDAEEAPDETIPAEELPDDPWGAEAFLEDVDHGAYGTTPEGLRDGLEVLTTEERVWLSPGIPFIVPLFFGTLVALTYGDLLFAALEWLGVA
jgi:preflagellin peptidase FlaK